MPRGFNGIPLIEDLREYLGGFEGKKILVRVDFNSPVDPKTKKLIDYSRIEAHVPTLRELLDNDASVVVISHQGKPGSSDFITLEQHAKILSKLLGTDVTFIDDIIGPTAREAIKTAKPGTILMLDNTRLLSEEVMEAPPEKHATTIFVQRLAPLFDGFVNDAFATAHRSQPSIVGFPLVLPSAAGRLMQKEIEALSKIYNPSVKPKIFVLGGGKVTDTIRIVKSLLDRNVADYVLCGGLLAILLLYAKGVKIGDLNISVLKSAGVSESHVKLAKQIIEDKRVILPVDVVVETTEGSVRVVEVSEQTSINGYIRDIGPKTTEVYTELMKDAKLIVMRGPMGLMEDPRFRKGTEDVIRGALTSGAFIVFGGGHLGAVARQLAQKLGIASSKFHISSGGGALLTYLSGEKLPGIEALKLSAKKFYRW